MRSLICCLLLPVSAALAQPRPADGPVLAALGLEPTASFAFTVPAGSIRLVAWERDSIAVHGHAVRSEFFFGGNRRSGKLYIGTAISGDTAKPVTLVVYYPRRGVVTVRTATADIVSNDLTGAYYTGSGTIRVTGNVTSLEAEAMNGNIDINVATPWVRARTGEGHLLIRGAPQDVDASTIGGALDIATPTILHGRFASVTGDIRYASTPAPGSLFEFSDHAGTIDFLLPRDVSGQFDLSSVTGSIANGFTQTRPVAEGPHNVRLNLGRGEAQFTVRTFKGTIRLRPQ